MLTLMVLVLAVPVLALSLLDDRIDLVEVQGQVEDVGLGQSRNSEIHLDMVVTSECHEEMVVSFPPLQALQKQSVEW